MNRTQRASGTRRNKPVLGLLALIGVVLLYGVAFGRHGVGRYFALRDDLARRSGEAYQSIGRNREMTEKVHGLRTDKRMLEEAARSTLGVVHDDEIVIVFRDAQGSRRR